MIPSLIRPLFTTPFEKKKVFLKKSLCHKKVPGTAHTHTHTNKMSHLYDGVDAKLRHERPPQLKLKNDCIFFNSVKDIAKELLQLSSLDGVPKHLYSPTLCRDDETVEETRLRFIEHHMPEHFLLDAEAEDCIHIFCGRVHIYLEFEDATDKPCKNITFRVEIADTEETFKRLTINGCTLVTPAKNVSLCKMFEEDDGSRPQPVANLEDLADKILQDFKALNREGKILYLDRTLVGGWCCHVEEDKWNGEEFEQVLMERGLPKAVHDFSSDEDIMEATLNGLILQVGSLTFTEGVHPIGYTFCLPAYESEERRNTFANKRRKT